MEDDRMTDWVLTIAIAILIGVCIASFFRKEFKLSFKILTSSYALPYGEQCI